MDKNAIKKYAIWARNELIAKVSQKAAAYGIEKDNIVDANADSIDGVMLSSVEKKQRKALIEQVNEKGYEQVIEEVAYTWFNRFTALRFMEVNGYLPSRIRVFTDDDNNFKPQILTEAIHLNDVFDKINMDKVLELKQEDKTEELYKYLLIIQCNSLNEVLPRMFQKIEDYSELLLPDYLLREGSVIERLIAEISEDDFNVNTEDGQIEIIGWLYQYYISEKHEKVVDPLHGKIVDKEEVPAATQLFTTDWVVRYLIDNSVGRYWIERNPDSKLADELTYFVKPKNSEISFVDEKIVPQDVTTFDPCVGSGHFLIYAFDVLVKIYVEYGYSEKDAASEIVKNNLYGLDIDGRAIQLAYFAVMMKARQYDRRFFTRGIQPLIYEITESNNVDKASLDYFYGNDTTIKNDVEILLDTLIDAKEYGSILQMPGVDFERIKERFGELIDKISMYNTYIFGEFKSIISPAYLMSQKYAVVATNPPYLNKYDSKLKDYINSNYKEYNGDLFSVFIYRNFDFCKQDGYSGFMTPYVWMFIKTYESLRRFVIDYKGISNLVQLEYSAFEDATVPICTFVLKNGITDKGYYFRLSSFTGGMEVQRQKVLEGLNNPSCSYFYEADQKQYKRIPGCPISYWVSNKFYDGFGEGKPLKSIADPKQGMSTANNDKFLRLWFEVNIDKSLFDAATPEIAKNSKKKWFPQTKGGPVRKWYGNNEYLVNWYNDGYEIRNYKGSAPRSTQYYFQEGLAWSTLTVGLISFRYTPQGFTMNTKGSICYLHRKENLYTLLGFLNSKVTMYILTLLAPTLDYSQGPIGNLPIIQVEKDRIRVEDLVKENIRLSKEDWDAYEVSWDYKRHPLVCRDSFISAAYDRWEKVCNERFMKLKHNEEELNQIFINLYGLEDELSCAIKDKDVTVRRANLKREIKSFISYAVGCMFGRYSLDEKGIAFAGGRWDSSKYKTFIPDEDAVIPICDDEYFEDDIVGRFIKFVEVVYGKEKLEENLQFIVDALGGKGTAREILRNYFINDFYVDHVKIYQKRPIYWLFDSGKKNGFKCLIYMHRYQPDMIARIRTDYVHEQQARYRTAISEFEQRINDASTSDRVKLTKRLNTLKNQDAELRVYEEKIHHLADQMIEIDLDDGVKVNYAKFQDVLAKIK